MTPEELAAFRSELREALAAAGRAAGRKLMHAFSRGAVAAAGGGGGGHPVPPFAIICSRTVDLAIGRCWELDLLDIILSLSVPLSQSSSVWTHWHQLGLRC